MRGRQGERLDRTDRALIEESLAGRLESFDALMQRYERLVYRVSVLYGGNRENALDISQNTFLKCYRHLRAFRGDSAFKTWLLRIAYNEGLNWVRSRQRHGETEELDAESTPLPGAPAPERDLVAQERRTALMQKLDELNPRQRTAVTLRYFRQMPLREIADVLECSEGNVKNMLFRSVRKLRQSMAGSGIEGWV
jgi:RNA polymerase sigma-70 factor (ECF subfamily)